MSAAETKISEAQAVLQALGLPPRQQNRMSALTLLAVVDLKPKDDWRDAHLRLIGIDAIRQWMAEHYDVRYAPNTRETIRRQAIHYFMQARVVERNPDNPNRATNDKNNVYGITVEALQAIQTVGTPDWEVALASFHAVHGSLIERYSGAGSAHQIPVVVNDRPHRLSPGKHNALEAAIVNEFAPRFAPGADVLYLGDAADKDLVLDIDRLSNLRVPTSQHDKLPDVILYDPQRNWLFFIEAVTSHGPVSPKRHEELKAALAECTAGMIYVTAFPDQRPVAFPVVVPAQTSTVRVAGDDIQIALNGECRRILGSPPPTRRDTMKRIGKGGGWFVAQRRGRVLGHAQPRGVRGRA